MNYWNMSSTSSTIAHLVQSNNTLSAEIDIAAQSTVMRIKEDGTLIADPLELINCSRYGNAARNSDPMVSTVLQKYDLSLPQERYGLI